MKKASFKLLAGFIMVLGLVLLPFNQVNAASGCVVYTYRQGNSGTCVKNIQTIITLKPYAFGADHSKEAQDAMYLLSLSHLKLRHCEATIDISRRFAQLFPQHKNASEALYNVIACQVSLQQKDIARETLRLLANDYPNSSALARAKAKLK